MMRVEKDPAFVGMCMNHPTLFRIWIEYAHGQPILPAAFDNDRVTNEREREMLVRMVKAMAEGGAA